MPHTPHVQDQTIYALEARRDQLFSDLCQLHLDELGASQMGDDAGAAEAAALMDAVQREIAEIGLAIEQREAEIARVRADQGPFSLPHPPINSPLRGTAAAAPETAAEEQEEQEEQDEWRPWMRGRDD